MPHHTCENHMGARYYSGHHHVWNQAPMPARPSHLPKFILFFVCACFPDYPPIMFHKTYYLKEKNSTYM